MPAQSFAELACRIQAREPQLGATRLVVVDGPAGSGKTTFAGLLAHALELPPVVHLDDLYEGWSGLDEELWHRLDEGVLTPLASGRPGRYQRYDWEAERFAQWCDVVPTPALIVEGVGAAHRRVDPWASLRVWVEAPAAPRLERGLRRDGPDLRERWLAWMACEAAHFSADGTRARADLVVDGRDSAGAPSSYVLLDLAS